MLPDPDEFDASRFVRNSNELRNDSLHSSAASILGRLVVRDRKPVALCNAAHAGCAAQLKRAHSSVWPGRCDAR